MRWIPQRPQPHRPLIACFPPALRLMSRLPVETTDNFHYYHMNSHHAFHPELYDVAQQPAPAESAMGHFPEYWQPQQYQRKRPKYTRSKTGCLTCRAKKVKCDEEKPDCARCRAGGRECVWPDLEASRKRTARREVRPAHSPSIDARPSTAESSGRSEASISPTRHFAPKAEPTDLPLPPSVSNRANTSKHTESHLNVLREAAYSGQSQGPSNLQSSTSSRVTHARSYVPPPEYTFIPSAPRSAIDTSQPFAYHPSQQAHSSTVHAEQYQQTPFSYSPHTNLPSHSHAHHEYPHAQPVKTEYDDQEWQDLLSQHVDPLHPFAYPSMPDYYTPSHVNTSQTVQSPQEPQLSYPYLKYP